jgi:hypothetical protein
MAIYAKTPRIIAVEWRSIRSNCLCPNIYGFNSGSSPFLNNQLIAVSHGITGITGTALVIIGYYDLIKKRSKQEK